MAKTKTASPKRSKPPRKKWPASGSLKLWLECYLDSCEQLSKPSRSAANASVRLRQLAECGLEANALKRVERLIALLAPTDVDSYVRLALVGAEICLEIPNLKRAEKYLAAIDAQLPQAPRSKQQFLTHFVESFRILNGLAKAEDSSDAESQIGKYRHQYRQALLDEDHRRALAAIRRMTKRIPDVDNFLIEPTLILSAIKAYRRLNEDAEVTKYVNWIERNGHTHLLDTGSLSAMGLSELANKRAEKVIAQRLKELKTNDDPNIHFPVDEICDQLWFLMQAGESETAVKWLHRALRELPNWPGLCGGFSASGALTLFAEVLAELDGPDAARQLLEHAVDAATVERHRGFRQGSLRAANQLIETPGTAAAIAKASTIRNAKKRREALIELYAKRGDWSQVAKQLNEAPNVEDVHQLIHAVLFKLPGGARL
ncbi:hypothetical protein SH528x_001106 [Novipirellula sp. SH528]|uniref:hypothetical protein n=1 Tax=Novipirellula sp. SH528 TaxID=3454466 RepID=UPI003FA06591